MAESEDTIAVFTFPLPSPTNYALLANLATILSWVYKRVIIITGSFVSHLPDIIGDLKYSNKKSIYVYDFKYKLPPRGGNASVLTKFFAYVRIQLSFIVAVLKLRSNFNTALFFIGVPDMLMVLIILRLLRKKVVVY
ncbi:hypothetical protein [Infirmifilum sp. NZ]|uniref:hypothetical protein n=1 Tax=Infirmifilum sp. NZ TaxID=2926850 RepID=UPI0027A4F61D|nr:hypothetical protein [Infirmifilum sp. NZ]UNQ73154.1 hypothetical protein MOV14_08585 [Infirmifilum sp. NZ]